MRISNKTHLRPHSTGKLILKKPQNIRMNILNKKREDNSNKTTININSIPVISEYPCIHFGGNNFNFSKSK